MIKVTDTETGQEFEFLRYAVPIKADYFLGVFHAVGVAEDNDFGEAHHRAILRPIPKRYTAYGIVFEETGEKRLPKAGEWWLSDGGSVVLQSLARIVYESPILKPVDVVGDQP